MKRLLFIYLSVLLGLAASPAMAANQKETPAQSIPQSTVAPTATGMNTSVDSRMPRKANSINQTYREGGNHQKPQYNS